jgi:hypothetical protein
MIDPTGGGSEMILGDASSGLKVISRKNRKVNPIPAQARYGITMLWVKFFITTPLP